VIWKPIICLTRGTNHLVCHRGATPVSATPSCTTVNGATDWSSAESNWLAAEASIRWAQSTKLTSHPVKNISSWGGRMSKRHQHCSRGSRGQL
jgi:hypothetical protein